MKFSGQVYYRKMYFSFPMKEEPALREVYASLLKGSRNILVDCGVSYNYPDIVQLAAEAGLKVEDLDIIILTHCHADHTGGLFRLKQENPKLQIWAHPLCKPMLEDIGAQFRRRPVPAYYTLMGGSVPVDKVLEDGQIIDIGYYVKVIFTPGHSEDSLSLYLPEEKLLISGDAIPCVNDIPIYEDIAALGASLGKMEALPTDYVISSFCGLWDQVNQGELFSLTGRHLTRIQEAVDTYRKEQPQGSLEDMGRFVLEQIEVSGLPVPIFLSTIKKHVEESNRKEEAL